jgi:ElaB/YqjD/DUF883 family membrane-anchored ribosome-binding protein
MSQTESQGSSTMEQARQTAQDVGGQAQEKAQEAKSKAGERIREQLDTRSTQAGEQVSSVGQALRRTSEQLREDGEDMPARLAERGAEQADRLGNYLRQSSADDMLGSVESFGRRKPWLVAAGAALVGFAASRLLGASSSRRYQASPEGSASYQRVPSPGPEAYGTPLAGEVGQWERPAPDLEGDLRPQSPETSGGHWRP